MRHKYVTRAVVLGRTPVREAGVLVTLITSDLGLVRARAEGLRKPGAKLAHALQTFAECEATLLHGKDGWRLSGAMLLENRFAALPKAARLRAARINGLLQRLVHGEVAEPALFDIFFAFVDSLPGLSEEEQDAAECRTALRILHTLGLDQGPALAGEGTEAPLHALFAPDERHAFVSRINRGIAASGL